MPVSLDYPVFPQEMLDRLFEYILLDDVPHPDVVLKDNIIKTGYTCEDIKECYQLCWQLLKRGVDFKIFRKLIGKLAYKGSATPQDRLSFKYARARFKHMRFACNNFDRRHRQPRLFHMIIRCMGKMQDSFNNGRHFSTFKYGVFLWIVLSPLVYPLIEKEINDFKADTPEGIKAFHNREIQKLRTALENKEQISAHDFHLLRKIFSRWVSFNDTLRTVRPSDKLNQFSAYLATINGMMGDRHDEYVEKKFSNKKGYYKNKVDLPDDLFRRIQIFLEKETMEAF